MKVDESEFILIDLNRVGHKEDTFILTSQAKQVFYITDSVDKMWSIVLSIKLENTNDGNDENIIGDSIDEIPSFSIELTSGNNDITEGDVVKDIYMREDHFEGILVEKTSIKKKT